MATEWNHWQEMLEAISQTEDNELTCNEVTDEQITAYAETLLAEIDPGARFSDIRQHLTQCPDCRQRVDELTEVLELAQTNKLVEPISQPSFDLSFLPQPVLIPDWVRDLFAQGRPWVRDQMGALWISLTTGIAQPRLAMKGGPVTSNDMSVQPIFNIEDLDDLDLEMTATRNADPTTCELTIQAWIPSRWRERAGIEVMLIAGRDSWSDKTDETGEVVFPSFPIALLEQVHVKITPPSGRD